MQSLVDNCSKSMLSKTTLLKERALLIDEQFLNGLSPAKTSRLAEIDTEIDRRDAPRVARLRRRMARERAAVDKQIAALKAKIAKNAPDRPQTKSARLP